MTYESDLSKFISLITYESESLEFFFRLQERLDPGHKQGHYALSFGPASSGLYLSSDCGSSGLHVNTDPISTKETGSPQIVPTNPLKSPFLIVLDWIIQPSWSDNHG